MNPKLHLNKHIIKVISSNTKFNILKLLNEKEQGTKHLAKQLNLSQPTVTGHIKQLQQLNLIVRKQREGHIFVTYAPTQIARQLFNTKKLPATISLE